MTKSISKQIQGIGILLMVFHHAFGFPQWWDTTYTPVFFSILPSQAIIRLGQFAKICVPLFSFLSGYGFFFAFSGKTTKDGIIYAFKKGFDTLLKYWIIFALFTVVEVLFGSLSFSFRWLLLNLLGISDLVVPFAWYIGYYLLLVFMFSYICTMNISNRSKCIVFAAGSIICLLMFKLFSICGVILPDVLDNFLIYSPSAGIGYVVASNWGRLANFKNIRGLNRFQLAVCIIVVCVLRVLINTVILDFILVPFLCCLIVLYISVEAKKSFIQNILLFLGHHSFSIWMIHCIFFIKHLSIHTALQNVLYFPRTPLLIVAWCIGMVIPFCVLSEKVYLSIHSLFVKCIQNDS